MKSKYKNWTQEQLDFLLTNYGLRLVEEIARHIDKPIGSLYYILNKEDIDLKKEYWSSEDIQTLRKLYPTTENKELARLLLRSIDAIQLKAAALDLEKIDWWSKEEEDLLASMKHSGISYNEMSQTLRRTEGSIHNKLRDLNLSDKIIRWSQEEMNRIESLLHSFPNKYTYVELATSLHVSVERLRSLCIYKEWSSLIKYSSSHGEELLHQALRDVFPNLKIETQFCVGEKLRLDFFIPENNTGWEFDGIQHTQFSNYFYNDEAEFLARQELDKRKEFLCHTRGINLIRISYKENINGNLVLTKFNLVGPGSGLHTKEVVLTLSEKVKLYQLTRKETRKQYRISPEFKAKMKVFRKERYLKMKEFKAQCSGKDPK